MGADERRAPSWNRCRSRSAVVAKVALDGLAAGLPEIIADEFTRTVKARLSR